MKFVTAEPERFHPYLVSEFYQNAVVATNEQSFTTEVYVTQLDISPRFLAEEFEVNNSGVSISSYLDGVPDVEKNHWLK